MRAIHVGLYGPVLVCLLASCSFTGLDQYDLKPCTPRTPCAEANARLAPGQCEEYVCDDSGFGCVPKPRDRDRDDYADAIVCKDRDDIALDCDDDNDKRNAGMDEICDGIDNDCNDWIDEGTRPEPAVPVLQKLPRDLVHASVSAVDESTLYVALTYGAPSERTQELVTLVGDQAPKIEASMPKAMCPFANGTPRVCNFGLVSIAAIPDALFGAAINYGGCGTGQLRVGGSTDGRLLPYLAQAEGHASFGVDLESGCTQSTSCLGVSQPVIAALPGLGAEPAQALVVWNAPLEAPICPRYCAAGCNNDGPVSIAATGVRLERSGAVLAVEEHSETLGDGVGSDAPAVVAWPGAGADGGYFAAFTGGDQLELRFVPRLASAAGSPGSLRGGLAEGRLSASEASHAALALDGSARDAPRGLAVAYRVGRSTIAFVPLEFEREADPALSGRTAPIPFETTEPIIGGPVLAYARNGFVESEDSRKTGGWLVAWIEETADGPQRLMAARITQTDTQRLGPPIELARGTLRWPFVYVKQFMDGGDVLAYGFVDDTELRLGQVTCKRLQ